MNAIDTLEAKNAELQALIEDHRKQADMQVNTLNMKLGGICDPAVNGGLANYAVWPSPPSTSTLALLLGLGFACEGESWAM